jgi:DNA-binding LytR/AlgR family response regulator
VLIVFKFLFEPLVAKNRWTLGKNILWDFIIASSIGAANYFYICIIFKLDLTPKYLLYSIWTAILVGSIPVTISYFLAYNRRYRSALKEADVHDDNILWENEVSIKAGNQKNDLRLNPKNIIYFCSNDNYVTIVTIKGDSQSKTTIRGTLKAVESELKRNSIFMRCHKCYIVNASYIERITGNTQNMKIKMKPSGFEIPVSRAKVSQVIKKLKIT